MTRAMTPQPREVEARVEIVGVARVRRRGDPPPLGVREGDPQRGPDLSLHHLAVAHDAGEDGQPGLVAGGPGAGTETVRPEHEDRARARACRPSRVAW